MAYSAGARARANSARRRARGKRRRRGPRPGAGRASTPRLKVSSATDRWFCGRPISASAPAKPRPCISPKRKATSAGQRRERVGLLVQRLAGDEHDGKRDRGFDRRRAQREQLERAQRERNAVRDGERGDGPHQPPVEAHEKQQRQHEQQVVDAAQDVLDAEHAVGRGDLAHAALVVGRAVKAHRGLR